MMRAMRVTSAPDLPNDSADAAAQVLRRFRLVFSAVRTHFQQVEKRSGVGGAQVWALSVLEQRPGIGVGDLARAMDIHQSTASNLVRGLVERGLARADKSLQDRRGVQLRLLPAGRAVLRRAPGPSAGVLPQALAGLDAATLSRLRADLDTLLDALPRDRRGARTPLAEISRPSAATPAPVPARTRRTRDTPASKEATRGA